MMSQSYSMRALRWFSLCLLLCSNAVTAEEETYTVNITTPLSSESTHFIITLKPPLDPPVDFQPSKRLHHQAALMMHSIPKSTIIHSFDNIATYFKIYMFSIQLDKNEDLAILGDIFGQEIKSVEAISSFYASELVTDVRNLAHGLPYRQVLNRPFRDLKELSGDKSDLQDLTCTLEDGIIDKLTQDVQLGVSMGVDDINHTQR
jgi:hypothetical protein